MRALTLLFIALFTVALAAPATAAVFLNGVNIDGVHGQNFENCSVQIDDKGNVHITAKGYEIHAVQAKQTPTPPPPPPVTKSYFLVAETPKGDSQYDVDVFINSVFVKRILSTEKQLTLEVTKYMVLGKNIVHFTAVKNLKEGRKSLMASDALTINIGEGTQTPKTIVLDSVLVEYVRTAAEVINFDGDVVFTGR